MTAANSALQAQTIVVKGSVFDITKKTPIQSVSVLTSHGHGTFTDSMGHYTISVHEDDSIYFSFLNRSTIKYAVTSIPNIEDFNISILTKVQQLPPVFVRNRSYKLDSLKNRQEYEKIFNYKRPGFGTTLNPNPGGVSVGVDLEQLINMFAVKKNKRMLAFQDRLIQQEKEKYIDHRFSKGLVKKLTGLQSPELDSFMTEYRPPLQMVQQFNDLELGQFIVEAYKYYKQGIKINKNALQNFSNQ